MLHHSHLCIANCIMVRDSSLGSDEEAGEGPGGESGSEMEWAEAEAKDKQEKEGSSKECLATIPDMHCLLPASCLQRAQPCNCEQVPQHHSQVLATITIKDHNHSHSYLLVSFFLPPSLSCSSSSNSSQVLRNAGSVQPPQCEQMHCCPALRSYRVCTLGILATSAACLIVYLS